jgi:diguanylate cyclase (GGDEF)-like protein
MDSGAVGFSPLLLAGAVDEDIADEVAAGKSGAANGRVKGKKTVAILVASAVVAVVFLCAGAWTIYKNMQHTQMERDWVDHSELVLDNVATQSERLERADFNLQLYAATGDRSRLRSAQSPIVNLQGDVQRVRELVADDAIQTQNANELAADLQRLNTGLEAARESRVTPDSAILQYRNRLAVLQQKERDLLQQRQDRSKQSSYKSFLLSIGYIGVSMAMVAVLFVFLFRDVMRQQHDREKLFAAKGQLEATVKKLTDRAQESALLVSARDEIQLCMTAQQAHESVVRHLHQLLPGTSGATLVINNSRRMVEIVAQWGEKMSLLDGFNPDACCGLRAGKARWRKAGKSELHCTHFVGTAPDSYLCVPLAAHGETHGFVFISPDTSDALRLAEGRTLLVQELVEMASLSIASLNLKAKLEGQSIRDGLTGLFNRHFMEIALERELHRAGREGTSLAVLMLDVDHFKKLNDTFGHEAGDAVLREVAECFRQSLREEDIICRYGGEEFVVIMPDTMEEAALRRAEMIRSAVAGLRTHFRGELIGMTTVSVGVAMYPTSDREGRNLIQLADGALYRAKRAGRNMVMLEASGLVAHA